MSDIERTIRPSSVRAGRGYKKCCGIAGSSAAGARRARFGKIRFERFSPESAREASRRGSPLVMCLSAHESFSVRLNSPLKSRSKAESIFPSLLDIQLPFPLEECVYEIVEITRSSAGTVNALVCGTRGATIRAFLDHCASRGLDPVRLDHEGLALWTQSVQEIPPAKNSVRVLVHLAEDHTTVVVGRAETYIDSHGLRTPAESGNNDSLTARITAILRAGIPDGTGVEWIFCGEKDFAAERLHERLSSSWPGAMSRPKESAAFLARALCERTLNSGPMRCNLRRGAFVHPDELRAAAKRENASAAVLVASGVLMALMGLSSCLLLEHRHRALNREIAEIAGDMAPNAPYGMETLSCRRALDESAALTAPFLNAFSPSLSARLAQAVREGRSAGTRFETLKIGPDFLEIGGKSEDWEGGAKLEPALIAMGYEVKIERQDALSEDGVGFRVQAREASR